MYRFQDFREDILKHFPPEPEGLYTHSFRPGEMVQINKRGNEKPPTKTDIENMAAISLDGMAFEVSVFESGVNNIPCKAKGSIVIDFPSGYFFSFAAEYETSRYVCINIGWRGHEDMTEEKYKKYLYLLEAYFDFPA